MLGCSCTFCRCWTVAVLFSAVLKSLRLSWNMNDDIVVTCVNWQSFLYDPYSVILINVSGVAIFKFRLYFLSWRTSLYIGIRTVVRRSMLLQRSLWYLYLQRLYDKHYQSRNIKISSKVRSWAKFFCRRSEHCKPPSVYFLLSCPSPGQSEELTKNGQWLKLSVVRCIIHWWWCVKFSTYTPTKLNA